MNTRQHPDGPDGPNTDDLGFRDDAEERAYERAQNEPAPDARTASTGKPQREPPPADDEAVDAQAEPDDGEPANAG